jgi:hypothetical protein
MTKQGKVRKRRSSTVRPREIQNSYRPNHSARTDQNQNKMKEIEIQMPYRPLGQKPRKMRDPVERAAQMKKQKGAENNETNIAQPHNAVSDVRALLRGAFFFSFLRR